MDLISDFACLEKDKPSSFTFYPHNCYYTGAFYINRGNCHRYPINWKKLSNKNKEHLDILKEDSQQSYYAFKPGTFKITNNFISFAGCIYNFYGPEDCTKFIISRVFDGSVVLPLKPYNWNVGELLTILDKFPYNGLPFLLYMPIPSYFSYLPFLLQSCKEERLENIFRRSSDVYDTILYMYCHMYKKDKVKKYLNSPYKKEIDLLPWDKDCIVSLCRNEGGFYYCNYIKNNIDILNMRPLSTEEYFSYKDKFINIIIRKIFHIKKLFKKL